MSEILWLMPALPLAGALLVLFFGPLLGRRFTAAVACSAVGGSALAAVVAAARFNAAGGGVQRQLWPWIEVAELELGIGLSLDGLALVMVLVVTVVGFLIHLYSAAFMAEDPGHTRFFTAMNLFVAAMLVLVLADNLVLLYLGWEGVGLCSYLLIGFWYRDEANGLAARKAFVVTRIGDTALALGIFLIFVQLGTLGLSEVATRAAAQWAQGSPVALLAAALVLGGALGKSAQLPLQTWLPDAMAGPTPVSALIHAATMVTAGVYLVARTHVLFELAPAVATAVALIGAVTLLLAGGAALAQDDIKRVLAYSTISQLGYMFLALGVGAWSAAIFHLLTHACFKSLLFLAAGVVIMALDDEHDIHRMGGLFSSLPVTSWCFVAGAAALAGLPLLSSGFYSKGAILAAAWQRSPLLWLAGLAGTLLTALYIFRVVFVAFAGARSHSGASPKRRPGTLLLAPLVVLAVLALAIGFLETPDFLGGAAVVSHTVNGAVPVHGSHPPLQSELLLELAAAVASLCGVALAWWLLSRRRDLLERFISRPAPAALRALAASGWGFDALYQGLVVRPFVLLAERFSDDPVDRVATLPAAGARTLHRALSLSQDGRVRSYLSWLVVGAVLALAVVVLS